MKFPEPPELWDMVASPDKGDTIVADGWPWIVAKVRKDGILNLKRGLWPFRTTRELHVRALYPQGAVLDEWGLKPGGETTLWRLRFDVLKAGSNG